MQQDFKSRKEEEEAKAKKRERFILAVKEGTEFAGVIARSNEMMDRRRQTIVSWAMSHQRLRLLSRVSIEIMLLPCKVPCRQL